MGGRDEERFRAQGAKVLRELGRREPAAEPLVSVVIPSHDYGRFLPECLGSLGAQQMDLGRVEVLLVDDASRDGSPETACALLAGMPLAGWQVLAVERTGRPGPVRNAGILRARGVFLLCLDPDDQLLPGFLDGCLAGLAHGDADVAYTGYFEDTAGLRREIIPPEYHPLLLANQNIIPPAALMRRRVWELGARFSGQNAYEDWDFWVQAAVLGARFVRVAAPLLVYRQHGANYSNRARAEDAQAKAQIVLDNPTFFPAWTRAWARGILRQEPWAEPMGRGIIPVLRQHVGLVREAQGLIFAYLELQGAQLPEP